MRLPGSPRPASCGEISPPAAPRKVSHCRIGSYLREQGVLFAGLDVIGNYLTEINITSPTCIRELDAAFGLDIAGQLMEAIESKLRAR